jgi:cobaltochelatase CobS
MSNPVAVTPIYGLITNVQQFVEGTAFTPSLIPERLKMGQRAVQIFDGGHTPAVAKDTFLSHIRMFWDAHPTDEQLANTLIDHYRKAAHGTGGKMDSVLSVQFTARQLLKYMSWDTALLLCATAANLNVIETCLASLNTDGSLTTWLARPTSGYNRIALITHARKITAALPKEAATMTIDATIQAPVPAFALAHPTTNEAMKPAIDAVLKSAGVPMGIDALMSAVSRLSAAEAEASKQAGYAAQAQDAIKLRDDEIDTLKRKVAQSLTVSTVYTVPASSSAGLPTGKSVMSKASDLFPTLAGMSLEIPSWEWDAPHPDVPAILPDYIFRKEMLVKFLLAMKRGTNTWFQGHTGSGKTTFVEQVAARLNWPVARIAFDSAIDRSELVGRMQLSSDGNGGTVSEWLKGVLELAIPNAYILLCDEFDAGRPDALYVMQEILEHKAKRLLEDGGRLIAYHPMSRVVATGNTCGSGDPSGIYPATRILSGATLDRFPSFIHVPYMTVEEEVELITKSTTMDKNVVKRMAKFATEMREAFVKAEIPISYSPRRSVAFARATEDFVEVLGKGRLDDAMSLALQQTVYDASPEEFRQRIVEIARASLGGTVNPTIKL